MSICGGPSLRLPSVLNQAGVVMAAEPNNDSPLNSYAAALWNNQEGASVTQNHPYYVLQDSCFTLQLTAP